MSAPSASTSRTCTDGTAVTSTSGPIAFLRALLAIAVMAVAVPAAAQTTQPQRSGDWDARCDTAPGTQQRLCILIQRLKMNSQPDFYFAVVVVKQEHVLHIIAPLGVLLPNGVALRIDGADAGTMPFSRCLDSGCVSEIDLDPALVRKLKAGTTATFVIYGQPNQPINIPASLNGLAHGYDTLS